jgi:hypothetical protein
MCHQLVSSGTPARSLDLRSPLFLTMCSCVLWDCQTLLHNWIVIKVVFWCMTKYGMGYERIKMEGGCQWAPLGLVVTEVGKEGIGGHCSWSWSPRWGRRALVGAARPRGRRGAEGGCWWEPLVLVVAEVGKEDVDGSRSSSWSPRWGRRASVGAPHGHGRRGGEGRRRWAPLVVVVAEVGKEGVGGCRSWSSSLPSGPKLRAAYRLRLAMPPPTASASPCRRLPPPPRQAQRSPCRRLPRRLSPRQKQSKERRERTE